MSNVSRMFAKAFEIADRRKNAGLTTPEDVIRFDDIGYGPDPVWNLLDVYRPRNAEGPLPVIIDVHGGGWVYGDKYVYQYYCMSLARRGFAVVNFSYRLAPEHAFPAGMEDTDAVVRFVLSHADEYGFDLSRVFMVGDSAGAHMTLMYCIMCTNPDYAPLIGVVPPEGFVPSAAVLNCGVYDIREMLKDKGTAMMLLKPLVKDLMGLEKLPDALTPGQEALLCPVHFMNDRFPTCYVMTSTGDFLASQPDFLLPALDRLGIRHVFKAFGTEQNKLSHVFHCDLRLPDAELCNDEEMEFLRSLGNKGEKT